MKTGVVAILSGLFLFAGAALGAPRETVFPDDRTLGLSNAPVVVVEYLAPVCPHCARFAATTFPEIKRSYIDTGKVLYVIRIFPISPVDGAVAGMAKCMPRGRYYEFLDLAFKNQPMWDPDGNTITDQKAALIALGGMGGLKPEDATRCMADKDEFARVNRIAQDGADRYHIEAVPTLVVDGKVLSGEETAWPALKTRIDGLVAEAAAAVTPAGKQGLAKPKPAKKSLVKAKKSKKSVLKAKKGKKAPVKLKAPKTKKAKKAKRH